MQSPPSAAAKQMQLSYVGRITAQLALFAAIIDVDERCDCNPSPRRQMPNASLQTAMQTCRTDRARRRSGP